MCCSLQSSSGSAGRLKEQGFCGIHETCNTQEFNYRLESKSFTVSKGLAVLCLYWTFRLPVMCIDNFLPPACDVH